jgi:hypothetical protein
VATLGSPNWTALGRYPRSLNLLIQALAGFKDNLPHFNKQALNIVRGSVYFVNRFSGKFLSSERLTNLLKRGLETGDPGCVRDQPITQEVIRAVSVALLEPAPFTYGAEMPAPSTLFKESG